MSYKEYTDNYGGVHQIEVHSSAWLLLYERDCEIRELKGILKRASVDLEEYLKNTMYLQTRELLDEIHLKVK